MPGTILVVDDEPQILQTVAGILADEGFEVLTAPDGESALKLVAAGPPDLVLLDIALPGMDGLTALQELKRQYAALPVVMVSAYGSVENAVKATRLGAYDFIEKPPHADKILLTVRNALEMARLTEENWRFRQQAAPAREILPNLIGGKGQDGGHGRGHDSFPGVRPYPQGDPDPGRNRGEHLSRRPHQPHQEPG